VQKVGIGVLVGDTGERQRTLQHWSDLGILRPEPATDKRGRGYYREFQAAPYGGERAWALLASALSKLRIPLSDVKRVVEIFRSERDKAERLSPLIAALTGDDDVFFLASIDLNWGAASEPAHFLYTLPISSDLLEPAPDVLERYPSPESVLSMLVKFSRERPQACFLNLTKIFEPLRQ
jgi:hypothetical protein